MRFVIALFVILFSFSAVAEDIDGFYYNLRKDEPAPYAGVLLDYESIASIKANTEEKIKIEKKVCKADKEKIKAEADKEKDLINLRLQAELKDKEEFRKQLAIAELKADAYVVTGIVSGLVVAGFIIWVAK